ncbi:MAG: NAD(P)H-dependent oxidoreductase [Phycisphaerae bacterium]
MAKLLITYYTRTHHTEHMAEAIGEGAGGVEGAEVEVKPADQVDPKELPQYDGILMGTPVYYGTLAAQLKKLLDDSIAVHGKLVGKVGAAFASSANVGGGNETAVLSILQGMLIHGMVVQGSVMGDHYGAVAIGDLDERSSRQCLNHGRLVAELTVKLHG